jgi:hypothetical protein
VFQNKGYGVRHVSDVAKGSRPGMTAIVGARQLKSMFNVNRYTLSLPFLFITGPQSISQLPATGIPQAGPKVIGARAMTRALFRSASPEVKAEYEGSWVGKTKSGKLGGSIGRERASSSVISADELLQKSKWERTKDIMNKPGDWGETFVGRVATSWAGEFANMQGYTPEQRAAHINDVVSKTQSVYSGWARGELQRDPFMNVTFPAQTYALDAFQNKMEILSGNFGVNIYKTKAEKAQAVGRVYAWVFATSIMQQAINSARIKEAKDLKDSPEFWAETALNAALTDLPYVSSVLTTMGAGKGMTMPAQQYDATRAGMIAAWQGDIPGALTASAKTTLPGGAQFNRWFTTQNKIEEGKLPDDPLTNVVGSMFGWHTTPAGKENIQKSMRIGDYEDTSKGAWFGLKKATPSVGGGSRKSARTPYRPRTLPQRKAPDR